MNRNIFFACCTFTLIIVLMYMNYRVPFMNKQAGVWSIGYGESSIFPESFPNENDLHYDLAKLKKNDLNTVFMADPFFVKEKDTFYLFFEHQSNYKHGAVIGVMTSIDGKKYDYKGTVLQQPFHLSYPQVFKNKESFYMIPESKAANNVLLYKANKFPFKWTIEDTLIKNVRYKDPSIYLSDSLNIMVASDDELNLQLYIADSLKGKWRKHPKDIVLKGSEARAGGRFFVLDGRLYLPVQNCSKGYGSGISIYEFKINENKCEVVKAKNLIMHGITDSKFYSFGMHQLDIQKIGDKYYYVYDGNPLSGKPSKFNWKGTLKINAYDFLSYLNLF